MALPAHFHPDLRDIGSSHRWTLTGSPPFSGSGESCPKGIQSTGWGLKDPLRLDMALGHMISFVEVLFSPWVLLPPCRGDVHHLFPKSFGER